MQDIKLRYRGSVLGPFWITLTTIIMVLSMGLIFARLFHQNISTYLPFLMTGLVTWQFVLSLITEGCTTFTAAAGVIQQVPMPLSIHTFRFVTRNVIALAHSLIVLPFLLIWFQVPINWRILEVFPALIVLCINGFWIGTLLGMVSARFRDIPPIITNFVQVLFYVTPIFWSPTQLPPRWGTLFQLNPLFAAVDIMRSPLLGNSPAPYSWLVMLLITVLGSCFTFMFFARFRSRIAYWI